MQCRRPSVAIFDAQTGGDALHLAASLARGWCRRLRAVAVLLLRPTEGGDLRVRPFDAPSSVPSELQALRSFEMCRRLEACFDPTQAERALSVALDGLDAEVLIVVGEDFPRFYAPTLTIVFDAGLPPSTWRASARALAPRIDVRLSSRREGYADALTRLWPSTAT